MLKRQVLSLRVIVTFKFLCSRKKIQLQPQFFFDFPSPKSLISKGILYLIYSGSVYQEYRDRILDDEINPPPIFITATYIQKLFKDFFC